MLGNIKSISQFLDYLRKRNGIHEHALDSEMEADTTTRLQSNVDIRADEVMRLSNNVLLRLEVRLQS